MQENAEGLIMRNKELLKAAHWALFPAAVVCLLFSSGVTAQAEPNTAPFKAPVPKNLWATSDIAAARTQWLAQVE
jgi:hypothetical protein